MAVIPQAAVVERKAFALDREDERLRSEDLSAAQVLTFQEVEHGLERFFANGRATSRVAVHGQRGAPLTALRADDNARFEVVVWEHRGVHVRALHGIAPTGLVATVRGITLLELEPNFPQKAAALTAENVQQARLLRSVDWLSVFNQLGVVLASRPLVANIEERINLDV